VISADRIHFNGDGTAWVVFRSVAVENDPWSLADRPCDHCGGSGRCDHDDYDIVCPDCDGTGRHTFTVTAPDFRGGHELRVSVVPRMVLPIVQMGTFDPDRPDRFIAMDGRGNAAYHVKGERPIPVTLPSAAVPGMWAVKLAVAS